LIGCFKCFAALARMAKNNRTRRILAKIKLNFMKSLNVEKMEKIEGGFNIADACGVYGWAVLVQNGSKFDGSPEDAILFQLAFNYCLFG
jgi:hypothetical protein